MNQWKTRKRWQARQNNYRVHRKTRKSKPKVINIRRSESYQTHEDERAYQKSKQMHERAAKREKNACEAGFTSN